MGDTCGAEIFQAVAGKKQTIPRTTELTWMEQLYENFENAVFQEYFKFLQIG